MGGRRSMLSGTESYASGYSRSQGMSLQDMQKHVQNAAMDRYISSLEKQAKEASEYGGTWHKTVQSNLDEQKNEVHRRRELCQQNQLALRNQIEENKIRRADSRKEAIQNDSLHSFPLFTETFISEEEVSAYRKNQKKAWREELDQQMLTSKMLRNLEEKKHADIAVTKQAENLLKMNQDKGRERERLAKQAQEMIKSWDRDIRLKDLKKAVQVGGIGTVS